MWTPPATTILAIAILVAGGIGWWLAGRTQPKLMLGLGALALLAALVVAVTLPTMLPDGAMSPSPPTLDRIIRDRLFVMRAIPITAFSAIVFAAVGGLRAVVSAPASEPAALHDRVDEVSGAPPRP